MKSSGASFSTASSRRLWAGHDKIASTISRATKTEATTIVAIINPRAGSGRRYEPKSWGGRSPAGSNAPGYGG
jgi:hypothetical protein